MRQEEPSSEIASLPSTTVGLIPTMGALHAGHLSLIQRARQENGTVIVSIFINPLQFEPTEDYQRYPRTLDHDWQLCEQAGVDAIFAPTAEQMGIENRETKERIFNSSSPATSATPSLSQTQVVPPANMTLVMCGSRRPGHFQGVATIVTKLLNVVQPNRAYFGQKDGQQLAIIKRLVKDLNFPVEVVGCATVREASGLALSSRNQYLTPKQKEEAAVLYRGLQQAGAAFQAGERLGSVLLEVVKSVVSATVALEYVELVDPTTLMPLEKVEELGMLGVAARVGSTRLIDNIILRNCQPIVAIDGPSWGRKINGSRQVAAILGLLYLDTGAMYRALTWLVLHLEVALEDQCAIAEIASNCQIELAPSDNLEAVRVWINDQKLPKIFVVKT
jgi:pantoate ligase/cytidylate kinase